MPRQTLEDEDKPGYRGGALSVQPPAARLRYPCFAGGCPMPGTLFPNGARGDQPGTCVYHYAATPTDIPKVTQQLQAWDCVAREIDQARRVLTGPLAADARAQEQEFALAWGRLEPMIDAGWQQQLAPGTIRTSKDKDTGFRQSYGDWAKHLERFLGARVVEVLSAHRSGR